MKIMRTLAVEGLVILSAALFIGPNFSLQAQVQGGFSRRLAARTTVYDPFFERVPGAMPLVAYILSTPVPPESVAVSGLPANFMRSNLGTYWTLVRPPAPLPYNPFPEAPVFLLDATNHIFIIDDRGINYTVIDQLMAEEAEQAAEAAAGNEIINAGQRGLLGLNGGMNPMGGAGPNGPGGFDPDVLHVESLTLSNGFLDFDIQGLIPGNTFLLTRKRVLDDNFTNYWVPQWSFVATSTNQIVSIPFPHDSDTGFYLVVDYDLYQGPSPQITSPQDNTTVSGIITVTASLTDIFLPEQATLYVDEMNFGTITSGRLVWTLDTARFSNGPHSIDVRVISQIPIIDEFGSNNIALWTSDALLNSLNTFNPLAENVAPRGFTAEFGTVPFSFDTAAPAIVTVKIFDATGTNLVWNTSVTNDPAGTCYPYWNLLDNAGNPVPLPNTDESVTYNIVVNATPLIPTPGPDASSERDFTMNISTDPHAGRTAVFRNQATPLIDLLRGLNAHQDNLLNQTIGSVQSAHTVHPADGDGWERDMNPNASPFIFVQDSDFAYFFNVLTNQMTGQFLYICHSDGISFGGGMFYTSSETFGNGQVANTLGTYINDNTGDRYGHRVRLADIEACNSATGDLNRSFGSPDGLDRNPAMSKSSFVGWAKTIDFYGDYLPNTVFALQIKYWQSYWIDGGFDDNIGIGKANSDCLRDIGAGVDDQIARKIRGSKGMTWIKKD